jgi:HEAT repeat protein
VHPLAALVGDQNSDVGHWAATLLGRLGGQAAAAVPALAAALAGPLDAAVRQRAAWALGEVGPSAAVALEQLRHAASGSDPRLARLAQDATKRIDIQVDDPRPRASRAP